MIRVVFGLLIQFSAFASEVPGNGVTNEFRWLQFSTCFSKKLRSKNEKELFCFNEAFSTNVRKDYMCKYPNIHI